MLFQMDVSGVTAARAIELYWNNLCNPESEVREFADRIVLGFEARREEIDGAIRSVSEHWRLERMARVDRNILRLGAYELFDSKDIPRKVVLNEAVELAKRFGDEGSAAFINGVLDRIAANLEAS